MFIDGVPINSAKTGTTNIAQIPVLQIDHIEIVYATTFPHYTVSKLWGGVIQIFMCKGDGGSRPQATPKSITTRTQHRAGYNAESPIIRRRQTRFLLDVSCFYTNYDG